ncbi:hypothetical protein KC357_g20 [Hortaea werneckii]|nr:hypothetical protein KC357_g20 [Hortaea werneckii]
MRHPGDMAGKWERERKNFVHFSSKPPPPARSRESVIIIAQIRRRISEPPFMSTKRMDLTVHAAYCDGIENIKVSLNHHECKCCTVVGRADVS